MYSIDFEINITSSANTVFNALTNQDYLNRWFAPQVIAVPVEGTIAAFAFEFDLNFKVELISLKPDEMVHWQCIDGYKEWLDSEIVFKLQSGSWGVTLFFEHKNLVNKDKKEKTIASWNKYLLKLKDLCETISNEQ